MTALVAQTSPVPPGLTTRLTRRTATSPQRKLGPCPPPFGKETGRSPSRLLRVSQPVQLAVLRLATCSARPQWREQAR